jgi:hypothetical protein
VPDPLSLLRFVALVVFIGLVAVGLWLLDVAWWVVPPVMAGALLIAWTIEWVAWRGSIASTVVRETAVPLASPAPPPVEETPRVETLAPASPVQEAQTSESTPTPPRPEPTFEPPSVPEHDQAPPEPELEPSAPEPEPESEPSPPEPEPPQPETPPPPEATPEPEPTPPSPEPEPEPQPPPVDREPVASQPVEPGARRPRRFRLRSVPSPRPEQPPALPPSPPVPSAPEPQSVVEFRPRTIQPREWNLWDLERIARAEAAVHPERRDEWAFLFVHLRQFATADGALPAEFDGLVRESFGGLLERPRGV